MCIPVRNPSCNCASPCGCLNTPSIDDEINLLEANRQRMQIQLEITERKIEGLKKENLKTPNLCRYKEILSAQQFKENDSMTPDYRTMKFVIFVPGGY